MRREIPSKAATVRERVGSELKEFSIIAAYLFIVFAALSFYKSAILDAQGVHWIPWSFAAVKALIAAKFILLGHALHIGEAHQTKPLIWQTIYKSLAFLVLVAVLTAIEETVVGFIHGRAFLQSMAEVGGGTPEQMIATTVLMFLIFCPLFAFGALGEVMEEGALFRTFFAERKEFEEVSRQAFFDGSILPRDEPGYRDEHHGRV